MVVELLQAVQSVTRVGGDSAAAVLASIDEAIAAALSSSSVDDVAAAIAKLKSSLARGEAANDAAAQAAIDAKFPKGA